MTEKTKLISQKASAEANSWMIRLQEDPDDVALQRQFSEWLDLPGNDEAWDEIEQLSHVLMDVPAQHRQEWEPFLTQLRADPTPPSSVHTSHEKLERGRQGNKPRSYLPMGRRQTVRFAGLALAASFLGFLFGPGLMRDWQFDYTTHTAETRIVRLADDSVITLAPESAIDVSYTPGERHIHLLEGEAFFEVTPNPNRPFRVLADKIEVRVLGTGFTVHRTSAGAKIGVEHGRVQVEHAKEIGEGTAPLTAGQTIQMSWAGNVERGKTPVSQIGAWRQNQLIAQDQPLTEIVDRLRRYYGGVILVTDTALGQQPVTGVYNLEDPVRALYGIAQSQNASIRQITPWLLILSPS